MAYQHDTSYLIPASEALPGTSGLPDILWFFSHYKNENCLTLAQNPQFYEGPPAFPTTYGPASKTQPTEDYKGTIYVLTDNERRICLELGEKRRIFDNIWRTDNNALIFKGSYAAFLFLLYLTYFQTSLDISRAKTSLGNLSLPFPSSGLAWNFRSFSSKKLGI